MVCGVCTWAVSWASWFQSTGPAPLWSISISSSSHAPVSQMVSSVSAFRLEFCINFSTLSPSVGRLCGLVIRVPGYRSWGPGFDSRRYQIFWDVGGLERGPLSLVRINEELLEWKSRASGLENQINGRRDPLRWPRDTLYPQKLALTSPASGGRSVGIVRLRTKSHGV
jgi:hypothetical protein